MAIKYDQRFCEIDTYFSKAINEAHLVLMCANRDDVKILAPKYAIELLMQYNANLIYKWDSGPINKYCGYRIEVGYENKIIIFNEWAHLPCKSEKYYYELELKKVT